MEDGRAHGFGWVVRVAFPFDPRVFGASDTDWMKDELTPVRANRHFPILCLSVSLNLCLPLSLPLPFSLSPSLDLCLSLVPDRGHEAEIRSPFFVCTVPGFLGSPRPLGLDAGVVLGVLEGWKEGSYLVLVVDALPQVWWTSLVVVHSLHSCPPSLQVGWRVVPVVPTDKERTVRMT